MLTHLGQTEKALEEKGESLPHTQNQIQQSPLTPQARWSNFSTGIISPKAELGTRKCPEPQA